MRAQAFTLALLNPSLDVTNHVLGKGAAAGSEKQSEVNADYGAEGRHRSARPPTVKLLPTNNRNNRLWSSCSLNSRSPRIEKNTYSNGDPSSAGVKSMGDGRTYIRAAGLRALFGMCPQTAQPLRLGI